MSGHSKRTLAVCLTILIVGIYASLTLGSGLRKFNDIFFGKWFYDTSPNVSDAYQTVRLNDKQFVVVKNDGKYVILYEVDSQGNVSQKSTYERPDVNS